VAVSWIISGWVYVELRVAGAVARALPDPAGRGAGPWRRSGEAEPDLCGGGGWFGAVGVGGQRGSDGL
jgi:hypothetical protein